MRPEAPRREGHRWTISVVIPSHNTRDLLRDCLTSVERQRGACDVDVVVVDNGSTDGSTDLVREEFPHVRLVSSPTNRGYSGGVNLGLAVVEERDLTVILNSDAVVHDGAFEELCRRLAPLADVGAACPLSVDDSGRPQSYGSPIWKASDFARQMAFLPLPYPPRDPAKSGYVGFASGACLCLTRSGLRAIGRLDEGLVIYLEEQDIARRLQRHGLRCYYVASAVVTHVGGRTTRQMDRSALFEAAHLTNVHFFTKHFEGATAAALRILGATGMGLRACYSFLKLLTDPRDPSMRRGLHARLSALRGYLGLSGTSSRQALLERF